MQTLLNSPFCIGTVQLSHRLLQGPLAGFSCAPFRQMYTPFLSPAYCVSEMISAHDVVYKHTIDSRYLYRAPKEKILCYQLAGHDPSLMALAAKRLEDIGADLIDLNCGCPKTKIRKKGAGSALLDKPYQLSQIVSTVRQAIDIPLTVKLRICGDQRDIDLAQMIEQAGADALIIHGRCWTDDYDIPCDLRRIGQIKQSVNIPVIANGDIADWDTLKQAVEISGCDAYMISRAGTGKPWLYQQLLEEEGRDLGISNTTRIQCFLSHLQGLAQLENEYKAVLQSKTLVRYYFGMALNEEQLQVFYGLSNLHEIAKVLNQTLGIINR